MGRQLCHRTYKPKKESQELGYKKSNKYSPYYNSNTWHQLREWKQSHSPLCEACLLQGRSVPMNEVHHLHVFMSGKNKDEKWALFTNPSNLASLCTHHHKLIHRMLKKYNVDNATIQQLIKYEEQLKNKIE